MAETIDERGSTPFYFSKDTFDGVPISMANSLTSEACSMQCSRSMLGVIDEERGVCDVTFLTKLSQKLLCQYR
ncbi:hypothetical protein GCM10009039_23830 [Halocalculus aciditolerans]|uniref:Uncharacterized protein n=1 Tax=Halocalculus aciditolerans TaxID=1383812 RepID=A0A830FNM1_9EURY|nr:hypothetical protein GCM10009039_23830 [Halocalculus aciditolerans]